jgi:hypothetical protein
VSIIIIIIIIWSNHKDEMGGACGTYDKRKRKARKNVWGKLKEKGRLEGLDSIQIILNGWSEIIWTEFIWFIESNGLRT